MVEVFLRKKQNKKKNYNLNIIFALYDTAINDSTFNITVYSIKCPGAGFFHHNNIF